MLVQENKVCRICGKNLTEENASYYFRRRHNKISWNYECNKCSVIKIRRKHRLKREQMKAELFKKLGNKCKRCGFSDTRALQIDHINGGGTKEHKAMTWYTFRNYLLNLPESELFKNYQILCANCNWIKRHEEKEIGSRPTIYQEE